jgi:RimJ/RimL family protein N-acetyltransferase
MMLSNGLHRINLEVDVDNDVYWGLIKLGAELKMHPEEYIGHVIAAHVEHELGKQTTH